jgi:hypothetical protein
VAERPYASAITGAIDWNAAGMTALGASAGQA